MMQTNQIKEKKIINQTDYKKNLVLNEELSYLEKIKETWSVITDDVKVDVGKTSYEILIDEPLYRLLHYKPLKRIEKTPILIVYGLINRSYILDLQSDKSLINNLLTQGFDIFLIDWKPAKYIHNYISLEDYIKSYINHCVELICNKNFVKKITLLGYCMGSTMSVM